MLCTAHRVAQHTSHRLPPLLLHGTALCRVSRAIEVKDPDRTSMRVANALEQVASLELLQAPGLPYQLPRQLAQYPALAGAAVEGLLGGYTVRSYCTCRRKEPKQPFTALFWQEGG